MCKALTREEIHVFGKTSHVYVSSTRLLHRLKINGHKQYRKLSASVKFKPNATKSKKSIVDDINTYEYSTIVQQDKPYKAFDQYVTFHEHLA